MFFRKRGVLCSIVLSKNFKFVRRWPPGHFYSPIPDINEIHSKSDIIFNPTAREIGGVDINELTQLNFGTQFVQFYNEIPFPEEKQAGWRYYFNNDYFSYGDAISLYSIMRTVNPKRVIEVGSGYSSAEMIDIDDLFMNSQTNLTFIEPYPDRLLGLLKDKDKDRCQILRAPVQKVPLDLFHSLCDNDILFVDSSHVVKTDSDVLHLLYHVLPLLRKGVLCAFP